jgi:WD40 repeat protein
MGPRQRPEDGAFFMRGVGCGGKEPRAGDSQPDGSCLATARDGTARLWDAASGKQLAVLQGHTDFVRSIAFSPDGSRLATASDDRTARLWDAADRKQLPRTRPNRT